MRSQDADPPRLDDASLPVYLRERGLLAAHETAAVEPAGEGNINWVRRVRAGDRSFVVKQARPTLERFPEYQAPTERIVCEARFYERVRAVDREKVCPAVLDFDEAARVLVLEDLGEVPHFDALRPAARAAAARIARFLAAVHASTAGDRALAREFPNDGMRRLHGDHIFVLPFHANEFPLLPEVRARAEEIWREGAVATIAGRAYEEYLSSTATLVHGDVQPGNVLLASRGAVLLDAEIAHAGDPAFDLGILFAHLWLPGVARGTREPVDSAIDTTRDSYLAGNPGADATFLARAQRYAGLEILRRTLGAARVAEVATAAASLRAIAFALPLL